MKGLDRWITGNYGEDNYKPACECCGERPVYRKGLCYDCYQGGLEDEADGRRGEEEER